jgi:hypothetical protein
MHLAMFRFEINEFPLDEKTTIEYPKQNIISSLRDVLFEWGKVIKANKKN